jgi:hypothetical protein
MEVRFLVFQMKRKQGELISPSFVFSLLRENVPFLKGNSGAQFEVHYKIHVPEQRFWPWLSSPGQLMPQFQNCTSCLAALLLLHGQRYWGVVRKIASQEIQRVHPQGSSLEFQHWLKIVWILSIFTILGDGSPKMKQ